MHGHDHAHDVDGGLAPRPRSARVEEAAPAGSLRAAAAGRTDVLDGAGVLGLQRAVGNRATGALLAADRSPVHDVVASGGGSPLAPDVRADMEARLGHDFGDVRVHTGSRAHESAVAVGAHAYTVGRDVVFQRDRFDPTSTAGRTTLAHELTHVVQQRQGAVDGTPAAGGIRVSDPGDRFEREAVATAERAVAAPTPAPAGPAGPAVQREAAAEEEGPAEQPAVQGAFLQREAAEEDGAPEEPAGEG